MEGVYDYYVYHRNVSIPYAPPPQPVSTLYADEEKDDAKQALEDAETAK